MRFPYLLSASAACREADPTLFDRTDGELVWLALSYCGRCVARRQCIDFVRPQKSFYDGVVGGHVWRNGRKVDHTLPDAAIDLDDESTPHLRDNGSRDVPGVPGGGVHGGPGTVPDRAEDGG